MGEHLRKLGQHEALMAKRKKNFSVNAQHDKLFANKHQ